MKPRVKLAEITTADKGRLGLYEHDGAYSINFNGQELMHSKMSASETLLGKIGMGRIGNDEPARVLIGGLGLGFTLRSALELSEANTRIEVAELIQDVIDWNHTHLKALNGDALDDPRVSVTSEDVARIVKKAPPNRYDAIILDVDNGPVAMVAANNSSLYSKSGARQIRTALKPNGRAVFWSAGPDPKFESILRKAGFKLESVPAKTHEGAKRAAYVLFVADREQTPSPTRDEAPRPDGD